jgi:hypothetical protein
LKVKYNTTQLQKAKYVVPLKKKTHAQMITNLMENLTSIKISKQVKIRGTVLNRGPDRPLTDTCVAAVAVVRFSFLPTEMWCFVHLFSHSATRFNYQFFPAFLSRTGHRSSIMFIAYFKKKMAIFRLRCYVCNIFCIIGEVFLFTQITITNMVATCFCFALKI